MSCFYCLGDPQATLQLHFHLSSCKRNYFHKNYFDFIFQNPLKIIVIMPQGC